MIFNLYTSPVRSRATRCSRIRDGVIALYALSPTELLDMEKLASTEPLLTSPMTTKFDLSLDIGDRLSQIICAQFVAVSKHTDGTLVLIADPVYISNPERAASYSAVVGGGPKGVVSPDASIVGETAADRTIVELMPRACSATRARASITATAAAIIISTARRSIYSITRLPPITERGSACC